VAANVNSVDRLELVHRGGTGVSPVIHAQDARATYQTLGREKRALAKMPALWHPFV